MNNNSGKNNNNDTQNCLKTSSDSSKSLIINDLGNINSEEIDTILTEYYNDVRKLLLKRDGEFISNLELLQSDVINKLKLLVIKRCYEVIK